MNTGMPASRVAKKTKIRIGMVARLSIRMNLFGNFWGPAPALARMAPHDLDLPRQHHEAAEADGAVNPTHRQLEYGHALRLHALEDRDREIRQQRQEAERDEID